MGLDGVIATAEDLLRRNIRSPAARAAQKRRAQRRLAELLRRVRRALMVLAGLLAALVAYSVIVAPIGLLTWLFAVPTVFLLALTSLFWPTRSLAEPLPPMGRSTIPLQQVAARAEEALIDRYGELPGRALPAADRVIARLNELQPHLDQLGAEGLLAGDARRLICEHLPRLVDSYLGLPGAARGPGSDDSRRFAESLGTVADELDHLFDQCCRDRHLTFETQHRFIATRYSGDPRLTGR
ncbi:MAG TPA: hypothetical protein VF704_05610 [Allosphingosinicella sp.]|jgi:type IV secretory pathway TrbD component